MTNERSFIDYLTNVIIPYTHDQPAVLITDAYEAHHTKMVKNFCQEHHLRLVKVPGRATSILQPLDVAIFGMAKIKIYQDVTDTVFEIDRDEKSRWEATAACVQAINRVSRRGGIRAWKLTFPFWPEVLERWDLQ